MTRYACTRCSWVGTEPSTTESKDVDEDGRVRRRLYAICPKCFQYAAQLPLSARRAA